MNINEENNVLAYSLKWAPFTFGCVAFKMIFYACINL